MLKLTKTAIGLLTNQYRSVLRKCLLLNLGLFATIISFTDVIPNIAKAVEIGSYGYSDASYQASYSPGWCSSYSSWEGYLRGCHSTRNSLADFGGLKYHDVESRYYTISTSSTVIQNLEAIDRVIGGYPVYNDNNSSVSLANGLYLASKRQNNQLPSSIDAGSSLTHNIIFLDYILGALPSGTYVSNMQSMGDNVKALDTAIGAKIASDGHYIKKSATNSVTANLSALDYALYNYYYTFRVDERDEVTDSASFFQKDFSTLQEVDLHIKNPTHPGAFTKCDEACPRPSERFSLSLSQEQMLKNDASVDAGTSRHCLRQFGDVVADLLKNTAAKSLRIYEFMNEEVRHA